MTIQNFFYPKGVAVFGSVSEGKIGYELIGQIINGGFKNVYCVNPKGQGVFSAAGYGSIQEINQQIDLAVIASPSNTVTQVLSDCGKVGIKAAVVITSGFSETGNIIGENELIRIAKENGIRIIGPNCAGIVNTSCGLYATLETRPPAGKMAFISQSGALGGAVLSWAEEQGVGISKFVSYGNRVDLDEIELLPYLADDPETKVVALYIESVKNGREFMRVISDFTRKKPLVVIKSGRTVSGKRATVSHTGSLAGADLVYDSVFKQCGAIRVGSIEEMFDLCKGFTQLPPVIGKKLAIVTNSGGPGILAADRAEMVGLVVAEPGSDLRSHLAQTLPPNCGLSNPYDLTVQGTEEGYRDVLISVLKEVDAAVAINVATPYLDSVSLARGIESAVKQTNKPITANFMAGKIVKDSINYLEQKGIPNFATGERAVSVLGRMLEYSLTLKAHSNIPVEPNPVLSDFFKSRDEFLEPDAMKWLNQNRIPIPDFYFANNSDDAIQAGKKIGYPVVMKIVSPDIIHKSEFGGVIVGIENDADLLTGFNRLQKIAETKKFRGVIIYPLIRKNQEILLGMNRDPQFGPVIALGSGGIFTEVMKDVVLRIGPVSKAESIAMIKELKSFPILNGARGQEPCDLEALSELVVNFSMLPFLYPEVMEIDLNPVFLSSKGALVGDVRVIREK